MDESLNQSGVSIKKLPANTSRILYSNRVITSVYSVVKELFENSLDAKATSIQVKLIESGAQKIEVCDNGDGVNSHDVALMAKPHCTSKILKHSDLDELCTYGFRGEALGALSAISRMTVTTKTKNMPNSITYTFDHEGNVSDSKQSSFDNGTTICCQDIFQNIPVRKQNLKLAKKKKEELNKIESMLKFFAILHPAIRISLYQNDHLIWQKVAGKDTRSALIQVWGSSLLSFIGFESVKDEENGIEIEAYLPKRNSNAKETSRTSASSCFVAVNNRPIYHKEAFTLIQSYYSSVFNNGGSRARYPVCFISIKLPSNKIDVNMDPEKTQILFQCNSIIMSLLSAVLSTFYGTPLIEQIYNKKNLDDSTAESICSENMNESANESSLDNSINITPKPLKRYLKYQNQITGTQLTNTVSRQNYAICNTLKLNEIQDQEISNDIIKGNEKESDKSLDSSLSIPKTPSKHENDFLTKDNAINETNMNLNTLSESESSFTFTSIRPLKDSLEKDKDFNLILLPKENKSIEDAKDTPNISNSHQDKISNLCNTNRNSNEMNSKYGDLQRLELSSDSCDSLYLSILEESNRECEIQREEPVKITDISTETTCDNDKIISTQEINSENWSRGTLFNNKKNLIEPVALVNNPASSARKRLKSPHNDQSHSKLKRKKLEEKKSKTLFDFVSFNPVRKPLSPFEFFTREHKSQVLKRNEEISPRTIATILLKEWQNLKKEAKLRYEKLTENDEIRFQKEVGQAIKSDYCNRNVNKTTTLPFSLTQLKKYKDLKMLKAPEPKLTLIGECDGTWLISKYPEKEICAINLGHLQEIVLYNNLIMSHKLLTEPLQAAIPINENTFGSRELWWILTNLITENPRNSQFNVIVDPRLILNGFKIRLNKYDGVHGEIFEMAQRLPFYGISDLREILKLIWNNKNITVYQCRPEKVKAYLEDEAVRIGKKMPLKVSRENVQELINKYEQFPESELFRKKTVFMNLK